MQINSTTHHDAFVGNWVWLFPATYLIHIIEEYWGGEGFYRWISRVAGVELTAEQFLSLNAIFWVIMVAGVALILFTASWRWLLVGFGTVVLINGLLHIGGSLATRSYSPGLISGLVLWVPLGVVTLLRAWSNVPRSTFIVGILSGVGMHALVSLHALNIL